MKSPVRYALTTALLILTLTPAVTAIGKVDVKGVDHGVGKLKEVRAVGYIAAPPAKVWKAVTDYGSYIQFMPRIASSKLVKRNGNVAIATIKLNLPFPFQGTWYTNRYEENPKALSMKWRMLEGSINHTEGGWSLKPQGSGTMATYIVRTDLGAVMIPKVIADEVTKRTVPAIFEAVERRARQL